MKNIWIAILLLCSGTALAKQNSYRFMMGSSFVNAVASDPLASAALADTQPLINIQTIPSPSGAPAQFPSTAPEVPKAWKAMFMYRWASEAQMELDLPHVPAWISFCMYDNEDASQFPMTPPNEVAEPAQFVVKAANACHRAGKKFILSSAIRQWQRQDQSQNASVYASAKIWDGYSMQTQVFETDLNKFQAKIDDFKSHILAVNPKMTTFIVGVGDFASQDLQLPPVIETAIKTQPQGTIFWMNVGPHPRKRSGKSLIPRRPDILVQVIRDLAVQLPHQGR